MIITIYFFRMLLTANVVNTASTTSHEKRLHAQSSGFMTQMKQCPFQGLLCPTCFCIHSSHLAVCIGSLQHSSDRQWPVQPHLPAWVWEVVKPVESHPKHFKTMFTDLTHPQILATARVAQLFAISHCDTQGFNTSTFNRLQPPRAIHARYCRQSRTGSKAFCTMAWRWALKPTFFTCLSHGWVRMGCHTLIKWEYYICN